MLGDREDLLLRHPLGQGRDEVVVDHEHLVDLALRVELRDRMGDRLGVGVRGTVTETDPRLVDLVAPEPERRGATSARDEPANLYPFTSQLSLELEHVAEDLRVEGPGQ